MAFVYSADGKKIELQLAPDSCGVQYPYTAGTKLFLGATDAKGAAAGRAATVVLKHMPAAEIVKDAAKRGGRILPTFKDEASGLHLILVREIAVEFKEGVRQDHQKLFGEFKFESRTEKDFTPGQYLLTPTASEVDEGKVLELANRLWETGLFEFATPNFVAEFKKNARPSPLFDNHWHLRIVHAAEAWKAVGRGKAPITVAVLDDGVDLKHPDLKARLWVNPDRKAPDTHGEDFFGHGSDPGPFLFQQPFHDPQLNDIHGTACAGCVAAVAGNQGCDVRILPVKIFEGSGLTTPMRVSQAFQYASRRADIISCSWACSSLLTPIPQAIRRVVREGRGKKGCVVFCATGNDYAEVIDFPASHPSTLAVGAFNEEEKRASYSNYGPGIDFVAPSGDRKHAGIFTTDVTTKKRGFEPNAHYTANFSGTSAATPIAAGIGALVLAANPGLTWRRVRSILRLSCEKIEVKGANYDRRRKYSLEYGYGRVDAAAAVARALRAPKR